MISNAKIARINELAAKLKLALLQKKKKPNSKSSVKST